MVIRNPKHLENAAAKIKADGISLATTVLPDFGDGKTHEIEVMLSEKEQGMEDAYRGENRWK